MNDFVPVLPRTHRRCSTKNCSHAALFFPVLEFGKKSGMALELEFQYCAHCVDKIKTIEDMHTDPLTVLMVDGAFFIPPGGKKMEAGEIDVNKTAIHWYPLIVLEDSHAATPRFHD